MKKITLLICILALSGAVATTAVSCRTVKDIPEDLTAPQLLQKGQSCFDNADYKSAEVYYQTTIDRYGDDTVTYIEAKYELAHLYIKRKKYEKARSALDEILEIYAYAPSGSLPASYKKLVQIEMAKIPD
jgi:outer membrane protein assembly factor BamD (BamD/ComL family)